MKSNLVDVGCYLVGESDLAWRINNGTRKVWIPKSQAELYPDGKPLDGQAQFYTCTMPDWLAKEKELI